MEDPGCFSKSWIYSEWAASMSYSVDVPPQSPEAENEWGCTINKKGLSISRSSFSLPKYPAPPLTPLTLKNGEV